MRAPPAADAASKKAGAAVETVRAIAREHRFGLPQTEARRTEPTTLLAPLPLLCYNKSQGGDFMYNFIALWIRLITIVLLAVAVTSIALFFGRKKFKKWEKIISLCLAVLLVLLAGGSTLKSLVSPDIKTIVGTYDSEIRESTGLSPLQMEYCFVSENEKIYLDLDAISRKIMFDNDFIKGEEYTISYETESNLIVEISQNN